MCKYFDLHPSVGCSINIHTREELFCKVFFVYICILSGGKQLNTECGDSDSDTYMCCDELSYGVSVQCVM